MTAVAALADHLAPDCIVRLERAAAARYAEAELLRAQRRWLAALYLYGYTIEMCLAAAYFRSAGFHATMPIDRDTRRRRMAQARQLRTATGQPLMSGDPHPLVGWAQFLAWQRHTMTSLSTGHAARLREAVRQAEIAYRHWRPGLRYKITGVAPSQIKEVSKSACWFLANVGRL